MLIDFHDWDAPAMEGITWENIQEHGYLLLNVGTPDVRAPHAEGRELFRETCNNALFCAMLCV